MTIIAPFNYERYAILVSPLLIPGAPSVRPPQPSPSVSAIAESAGTAPRHGGNHDYDKSTRHGNLDKVSKSTFDLRTRIPATHPNPETGRGQNVDLLA